MSYTIAELIKENIYIVDTMKKRVIAIENGTIVRDEVRGSYDYVN